jgi:hypothetical protein
MKHSKLFLLTVKIIALLFVLAYAVGLFRTYDALQASAMTIIAALIGIDLIFSAKQAANKNS